MALGEMGFLKGRPSVYYCETLHRLSILERKEVTHMKARYEKPRMIIQAIVLATLAGQYDDDDDGAPV